MENPSVLERLTGNDLIQMGATGLAASSLATPLPIAVALLAPLLNSLAQGRYKKRVESAISELEQSFLLLGEQIQQLSDAQYKFTNEAVVSILQTLEDEKITYLKNAILNVVHGSQLRYDEASIISRIIRDISTCELQLLQAAKGHDKIVINSVNDPSVDPELHRSNLTEYQKYNWHIVEDSQENMLWLTGLLSLGLIINANVRAPAYTISPIAAKVLSLVESPTSNSLTPIS